MANKDHVEGVSKDLSGKAKEAAGNFTGDSKLQAEGKADQVEGKFQKALGDVKDALKGK